MFELNILKLDKTGSLEFDKKLAHLYDVEPIWHFSSKDDWSQTCAK